MSFLARLDKVQEELLYYPGVGIGVGVGVSKKFNVKVFYVMGKALSGKLSCPCDRSCLTLNFSHSSLLSACHCLGSGLLFGFFLMILHCRLVVECTQ